MKRSTRATWMLLGTWLVIMLIIAWCATKAVAADLPTPRMDKAAGLGPPSIAYASCSDDGSCFVRLSATSLPVDAHFVAIFIRFTPQGPNMMQSDGDRGARRFRFAPLPCYESWLGDSKVPKLQRNGTYYLVAHYASSLKVEGGWNTFYGPASLPVPVTWKGPITCP